MQAGIVLVLVESDRNAEEQVRVSTRGGDEGGTKAAQRSSGIETRQGGEARQWC